MTNYKISSYSQGHFFGKVKETREKCPELAGSGTAGLDRIAIIHNFSLSPALQYKEMQLNVVNAVIMEIAQLSAADKPASYACDLCRTTAQYRRLYVLVLTIQPICIPN